MKFVSLCFSLLAVFAQPVLAGVYDELTADQKAAVQNGEQVMITVEVDKAPWPKAFIYQRVDATPEECAAVFSDYELQVSYVPELKKSKISKRIDKRTTLVDYTLNVPWPLSDENYTVRDTVGTYDGGASYRVDWKLVRADSTRHSVGDARFERLGTGTIFRYYNFVVPGSSMAGAVKDKAMRQVKAVAKAIATQVEKERREYTALLERQLNELREALK
jgi:hypothetical protein